MVEEEKDIVEWLRHLGSHAYLASGTGCEFDKAADEIERLRNENTAMQQVIWNIGGKAMKAKRAVEVALGQERGKQVMTVDEAGDYLYDAERQFIAACKAEDN